MLLRQYSTGLFKQLRTHIGRRNKTTTPSAATTNLASTTPLNNNGIKFVAGGWGLFLLENIILSENREWLCKTYGEDMYHYGYNTLSTSACLSILYGFAKYKGSGRRWSSFTKGKAPLFPFRASAMILQTFGLACFAQLLPKLQIPVALDTREELKDDSRNVRPGQKPVEPKNKATFTFKARCPMDFRSKPDLPPDAVYGVERITRHHNLWALASLGVGTALITPFIVESAFFGGPLLLSTFGTAHQDARFRRGMGGTLTKEKEARTSNIPFAALLVGRQDWIKLFDEIKWLNCGVASLLVMIAHVR
jgi:hypothetical protein